MSSFLIFSTINKLIIMEKIFILYGCCFLPWWVVHFAWTCPAHSCSTAGTDGAGSVMNGWCSNREVCGCTGEAQSAFAPRVCATLSLLLFCTGKAASAAEGRHSHHRLVFKIREKENDKDGCTQKKSRDEPAVHLKRLAFIYYSLSSRGSCWAVDQFHWKPRKEGQYFVFLTTRVII